MGRRRRRRKRRAGCLKTVIGICVGVCLAVLLGTAYFYKNGITEEIQESIKLTGAESVPYQEVSIEEEELKQKFYYGKLSEEEKIAYKEIVQGVKENVKDIYVHASDANRTNELFGYVLKDFPEIFWCDGTAKTTAYEGKEPYTVLHPEYQYGEEEKDQKKQEIEKEVSECLAKVPKEAGDYEKILYVYEYIVNTVDYDMEADNNQNIYSVFVNKRSVCAGYSKATQYLLERLGVFCTYVTGKTKDNQSHAWNLVRCEGDYYYVDTTWGDPVFQNEEENISYDYMCCNDAELFRTHTPEADIEFPACTKMDRNYYVVNGMYFTEYDSDEILRKMNAVITAGENPSVFKFADEEVYKEAHDDIFGNLISRAAQNLAGYYGLSQVKYEYLDDNRQYKITIYWQYE